MRQVVSPDFFLMITYSCGITETDTTRFWHRDSQNFYMGDWLQEEFQILKLHEAGYRYFSIDIIYSCGIMETK